MGPTWCWFNPKMNSAAKGRMQFYLLTFVLRMVHSRGAVQLKHVWLWRGMKLQLSHSSSRPRETRCPCILIASPHMGDSPGCCILPQRSRYGNLTVMASLLRIIDNNYDLFSFCFVSVFVCISFLSVNGCFASNSCWWPMLSSAQWTASHSELKEPWPPVNGCSTKFESLRYTFLPGGYGGWQGSLPMCFSFRWVLAHP